MVEMLMSTLTTSLLKYIPQSTQYSICNVMSYKCISCYNFMYLHIHQIKWNNSISILIQLLFHLLYSIRGNSINKSLFDIII